jgi:Uri superfamily endonuclease
VVTQKGTYTLILQSNSSRRIQIGRLGKLALHPGYYLYVGSAFGPGGLKARLGHHLKRVTKPHWHIDYLRRYTRVVEIWYTTDTVRREDEWVTNMTKMPHVSIAHPGFGSSDSKGASHLFQSTLMPGFKTFCRVIEQIPNHAPIFSSPHIKSDHGQ